MMLLKNKNSIIAKQELHHKCPTPQLKRSVDILTCYVNCRPIVAAILRKWSGTCGMSCALRKSFLQAGCLEAVWEALEAANEDVGILRASTEMLRVLTFVPASEGKLGDAAVTRLKVRS